MKQSASFRAALLARLGALWNATQKIPHCSAWRYAFHRRFHHHSCQPALTRLANSFVLPDKCCRLSVVQITTHFCVSGAAKSHFGCDIIKADNHDPTSI